MVIYKLFLKYLIHLYHNFIPHILILSHIIKLELPVYFMNFSLITKNHFLLMIFNQIIFF